MPDVTLATTDFRDHVVESELRDIEVERRLVRRIIIWVGALVPIGAGLFAALMYLATWMAGTGTAAATLMGAGTGALAGIFFGTWAGVVASVNEIENTEDAITQP